MDKVTGCYYVHTAPPPAWLRVSATGLNSIDLTWMSVPNAAAYLLERRQDGESTWATPYPETSGTMQEATGLECGTAYEFQVKARGDGDPYYIYFGLPSPTAGPWTTDNCIPTNNPPVVENRIAAQTLTVGEGPVTIGLSDKFSDPDGDTLRYTAFSPASNVATVAVNNTSLTIAPVGAGSTTVTVTAHDRVDGDSDNLSVSQSVAVTVTALARPPAPTNLMATASGTTSIELTWESTTTGIAHYWVQSTTNPIDPMSWTTISRNVPPSPYTAMDLQPATTYHFRVFAYGDGTTYARDWSDVSNPDFDKTNTPIPAVPIINSATPGDGTITLDWNDVTYATSYVVYQWDGTDWVELDPNDPQSVYPITFSGSGATISGFVNGSSYSHRVTGKNDSGESAPEQISTTLPILSPGNWDVTPRSQRKAKIDLMIPNSNPIGTQHQLQMQEESGAWALGSTYTVPISASPGINWGLIIELDNMMGSLGGSFAEADGYEIRVKTDNRQPDHI